MIRKYNQYIKEAKDYDNLTLVVLVNDMDELLRVRETIKKSFDVDYNYNELMNNLTNFPNWLFIDFYIDGNKKWIYVNYWSDEGGYEYNQEKVLNLINNTRGGDRHIYNVKEMPEILSKIRNFFGILKSPNYTPKRVIRTLEERNSDEWLGMSTTGTVGSGTAVGGGAEGTFTKSAGQSVYGGDSSSSFGKNSNSSGIEVTIEHPINKLEDSPNYKKKNKKDKRYRDYSNIGMNIDKLYKVTKKVKNENMIKSFDEFNKLYEDGEGGGGGVSAATLGNTSGMGAIVSAQPSSIPGDVAGGTKGSGDIGHGLGVYTKQPAPISRKKKNKKDKKSRPYSKIGTGIDNFYVTKYVESNGKGRIIQSWDAFRDTN